MEPIQVNTTGCNSPTFKESMSHRVSPVPCVAPCHPCCVSRHVLHAVCCTMCCLHHVCLCRVSPMPCVASCVASCRPCCASHCVLRAVCRAVCCLRHVLHCVSPILCVAPCHPPMSHHVTHAMCRTMCRPPRVAPCQDLDGVTENCLICGW